ncbi:MAG: hypothetical protein LBM68_00145 [Bacteroidales bacterium]|jgi:hypothetical protein|nr:hypothetical protein [Bacteroidales bacterium]
MKFTSFFYVLIGCVWNATVSFAQQENHFLALPSAAKSYAALCDTTVWAVQNNPAALAFSPRVSAGIAHKNHYSIKGLNSFQANVAGNTPFAAIGTSFQLFGNEFYQIGSASLQLAKQIGEQCAIAIGGTVFFAYKELQEYTEKPTIAPDIAFLGRTKHKFSYAFHIVNPLPNRNSKVYNKSTYKIGGAYSGIKHLNVSTMLQKTETEPLSIHAGVEYSLFNILVTQIGFSNSSAPVSFGIDAYLKNIRFGIACEFHSYLGISNLLSVSAFL